MRGVFAHWPNRITALRFVGSIVLFVLMALLQDETPETIVEHRRLVQVAFWLFVVTAATDFLDGYLARRDKLVSAFGRIADPFTDKVLILGAMIFACATPWMRHLLPAWMVVVILSRELLVTGIRGFVEKMGGEFPADGFGKLKMIAQCCAVGGLFWIEAHDWPGAWDTFWYWLVRVLVWVTLLATIGSGLSYVLKAKDVLAGAEGER